MRRSVKIWCKLFGLTVRSCDDWPTSVLSMSARLGPSQSRAGSADALRKGRIASDMAGAAGDVVWWQAPEQAVAKQEPANGKDESGHYPAISGHGRVCPQGLTSRPADRAGCSLVLPCVQVGEDLRDSLVSSRQIAFQALAHNPAQSRRESGVHLRHRNRALLRPLDEAGQGALRLKGSLPVSSS